MKRRSLVFGGLLAVGLVIGLLLYSSWGQDENQASAKRVTLGWEHADLWPASRSWVWDVNPVATKQMVGVCVRTTESKIPAGTNPTLPMSPELPEKGAEKHSGWSLVGDRRIAGRFTCQVIDFQEAGLAEATGKQPLRLLVRLRLGGSNLLGITGQDTVLAGESIAGTSEIKPLWWGNELHLLTVYTRTADTLFTHHVLLQQRHGE